MISQPLTEQPALKPAGGLVAAFFDVDNTLLPGAPSEVRFFRFLWRLGLVGWRDVGASVAWWLRQGAACSLHPLRERKLYLAGKQPDIIEPLGQEFCRRELSPRVAPDGLAALDRHRRAGHVIILITGSLDFLVQPIAASLQVGRCLAARLEQFDGTYTGRVVAPLPYGDGKRQLMLELARQLEVDLEASYAYGDSPGDLEILATVGHPMVINPIRGMAAVAKSKGWPVATWK